MYRGLHSNGQKNGYGFQVLRNGEVYVGNFTNNVKEGPGVFYDLDGSTYTGEWVSNKKHGEGVYSKEIVEFQQQWKHGVLIWESTEYPKQILDDLSPEVKANIDSENMDWKIEQMSKAYNFDYLSKQNVDGLMENISYIIRKNIDGLEEPFNLKVDFLEGYHHINYDAQINAYDDQKDYEFFENQYKLMA